MASSGSPDTALGPDDRRERNRDTHPATFESQDKRFVVDRNDLAYESAPGFGKGDASAVVTRHGNSSRFLIGVRIHPHGAPLLGVYQPGDVDDVCHLDTKAGAQNNSVRCVNNVCDD